MKQKVISAIFVTLGFISQGVMAQAALATDGYPSRPIRLVVPFPPGGSVDQIGRLMGQSLAKKLGQPVMIENRAGGSTMIGTQIVAKSPADGLTLLVAVSSAATNPAMHKNMTYDLQKDLVPVSMLAVVPTVVYSNLDFPAKNINDLLEMAKTKPISIGSPGYGTMAGLTTELFRDVTKTDAIHVPYAGGAPATTDVMAGHIQALWGTAAQAYEHYRGNKVGAIGITGEKRHPLYPDVPTFKEQGIDLVTTEWYALLAPAGTPQPIIDKLNQAVKEIYQEEGFGKGFEIFSFQHSSPEELKTFIASETDRWGELIGRLGIKAN